MNAPPKGWRAIAAFTILACALSATLIGCTSKTSTVPPAQAPPAAAASGAPQNVHLAPTPEPALTLPRGTRLEVRLKQTIDVKHAHPGEPALADLPRATQAPSARART